MTTKRKYSDKTLKDTYYNILLQRIIHDEYRAGDIITEKSLVDEFGVSKSPVREALLNLCNDNLLKSIPRFGYEVIPISREKVNQMLEMRMILECGALARNWEKITDGQIQILSDLVMHEYGNPEQMEAVEHWKRNCNMHLVLFSFSDNKYMYDCLQSTLTSLGIAYVRTYWDTLHTTLVCPSSSDHKLLIEYLKERKKTEAIKCLEKDIMDFFIPGH